ncbi:MAG: CaiB/BaiF CoA-transferase family protein, partial [Dehalococcoidales bacterium]|nr:CaiB/BaiF CoA-transferase family protein [Dehalococcoidales bacterium]
YHQLPSHDINYISVAGALGLIGDSGKPVIPLNLLGDFGGGIIACVGILAALIARARTGEGQYIDVAMTDSVASLMVTYISGHLLTGMIPRPGGVRRYGGDPFYNVYQTKDGKYIGLGCREPQFIRNLCRALGREDLGATPTTPGERLDQVFSYFRDTFLTRTRDEWFDLLSRQEISVSKVNTLDEVITDPQMLHRGMVVAVEHPEIGTVKQIGIPIKLSATPGGVNTLGIVPGQSTDEILATLGYSTEAIATLRRTGVVT